jgi:folate-dependent phosphoribosylglycinamide formyltransferase PurN
LIKDLRIAVITQEDSIAIPKNIMLVNKIQSINLCLVCKIDSSGSLVNKTKLFRQGFGFFQAGKMGLLICINKLLDLLDAFFLYKLGLLKSLKSAAKLANSNYQIIDDPNDRDFINLLKKNNIDLVVSFSAPCIFRDELLKLPSHGCINLHCSLLPNYAGLLPSFWTLYENAEKLGASVHRMDNKIDNGAILGQVDIKKPKNLSMLNVVKHTKLAGGHLMVSVIKKILNEDIIDNPNHIEPNNYYSWPTVEQIKLFKQKGGRLI